VTAARWLATFTAFAVLGALGGLLALMTVPRLAGYTPFTILTGSMRPGYDVGDVVVDEQIPPLEARRGDVVTFHDPHRGGALVTHRVERVRTDGAKVSFVTRATRTTSRSAGRSPPTARSAASGCASRRSAGSCSGHAGARASSPSSSSRPSGSSCSS
jgi:hypothetical protein